MKYKKFCDITYYTKTSNIQALHVIIKIIDFYQKLFFIHSNVAEWNHEI